MGSLVETIAIRWNALVYFLNSRRKAFLYWLMTKMFERAFRMLTYLKKVAYIPAFFYELPIIEQPARYDDDERHWR